MEAKKFIFSQEVKKMLHEREERKFQEMEKYHPEIEKRISEIYEFLGPKIGSRFVNTNVVLAIAGLKGLADVPWVMLNKKGVERIEKLNEKIKARGLKISCPKNLGDEIIPKIISLYSLKGIERKTKTTRIPGIIPFDSLSGFKGFYEWNANFGKSLKLAQERGEIPAEVRVGELEAIILGYPDQAIYDFEECLRKGDVQTDLQPADIVSVSPYAEKYGGAVPEFDFYPEHANDPEIVAYIKEARLILKNFYDSQWFQKIVRDIDFLKAREESEKAKKEVLRQRHGRAIIFDKLKRRKTNQ